MDDVVQALRSVHFDEDEANEVADKLAKGGFKNLARLRLANEKALRDCGIAKPFEIQAVLAIATAQGPSSSSNLVPVLAAPAAVPVPLSASQIGYDLFFSYIKNHTASSALDLRKRFEENYPGQYRIFLDVEVGFTLSSLKEYVSASAVFVCFACHRYLSRGFCVVELIAAHKAGAKLFVVNAVFPGEIGLPYAYIIQGLGQKGDGFLFELIEQHQFRVVEEAGYSIEDFASAVRWLIGFKGLELHPHGILSAYNEELLHIAQVIKNAYSPKKRDDVEDVTGNNLGAPKAKVDAKDETDQSIDTPKMIEDEILERFKEGKNAGDAQKILRAINAALEANLPNTFLLNLADVGTLLNELGKIIINDLSKGDSEATWRQCGAITVLAFDDHNRDELGRLGACKAVVDALKAFGTKESMMATWGCFAVGTLASADTNANAAELGRAGACKAVLDALSAFGTKDNKIATNGCLAVGNLAANEFNKSELGRAGACKAVVDILNVFGTKYNTVAAAGCLAVGNLAAHNVSNKAELGRVGACKAVVDALNAFGRQDNTVAMWGCNAVGNLAFRNNDNKKSLNSAGALAAVRSCLDNVYKVGVQKTLL